MTKTGPELMAELMSTLTTLETKLVEVRDSLLEFKRIAESPSAAIDVKDHDLRFFLTTTDTYISQIHNLSLVAWRQQLLGIIKDAQRYRLMRDQLEIMLPEKENDEG